MFLKDTLNLFFNKDSRKELIGLIIGLVTILTFANVMMPDWQWLFSVATMILSSGIYRFIMVNQTFAKNDSAKLTKEKVFDFVVSKNIFLLLFSVTLFTVVIIFSNLFSELDFGFSFLLQIVTYNLFILGSENIIYIIHNKPVQSYAGGFKRDELNDIQVGLKNILDQIPSLLIIIFFSVLFFIVELNPTIYLAIFYYIICIISLIYFKTFYFKAKNY